MATKRKLKVLIDADGTEYDVKKLDPALVAEHELVERIMERNLKLQATISKVKQQNSEDINKFEQKHKNRPDGHKGNSEYKSFDGSKTVRIDRKSRLGADSRIELVIEKLREFVADEADATSADIKQLIYTALPNGDQSSADLTKLGKLRQLRIKHPKFIEAMELFDNCTRRIYTGVGQQFAYVDQQGKRQNLVLDYSRAEID